MNEHDTEARLRAAFRAKAGTVTNESMSAGRPPGGTTPGRPATVHDLQAARSRLRRSLPLLVAAAVIVAVAGTAATVTSLQSDRQAPATNPPSPSAPTQPVSSPTSSSPSTPRSAPTVSHGSGQRGTGSGGQAPPNNRTSSNSSSATHTITAAGVTLTVPSGWKVSSDSVAGADMACITVGGVARVEQNDGGHRSDNCVLSVQVIRDQGVQDPDSKFPYGNPDCFTYPAANGDFHTIAAANVTIDGEIAEYRSFAAGCGEAASEHWVAVDSPEVVFTRMTPDTSTHGAADAAVRTAILPVPRGLRVFDRGFVCTVATAANGVHVELDRVTSYIAKGTSTFQNSNPQAYGYDLPATLSVAAGSGSSQTSLTPAELQQVHAGATVKGVTPALLAASVLELQTNGVGVTTAFLRPAPGATGCQG